VRAMKRIALVFSLLVASCVPQGKYDQAVKDLDNVRAQQADEARVRRELEDRIAKLQAALDAAGQALKEGEKHVADLDARAKELQKKLDDATAVEAQLRKELERLGKDANKLLAEKGTLAASLDDAKARLEELRKAQAAADARAKLYKELALKLKKMTDAGQLRVSLRDGKIILALPNDVLFDSGKNEVKPEGKTAIMQLAKVLVTLKDRRFQVAGHTDNIPIHTAQFPSNWELSTSRAVEVVKILIAEGMPVKSISAAGYGEFDPIAPNDTAESRAKNRRIEITLQPTVDEFVAVPEDVK
jgi:chemotaxis protein MotB